MLKAGRPRKAISLQLFDGSRFWSAVFSRIAHLLALLREANDGLAEGTLKRLDFITLQEPFAVDDRSRNTAIDAQIDIGHAQPFRFASRE